MSYLHEYGAPPVPSGFGCPGGCDRCRCKRHALPGFGAACPVATSTTTERCQTQKDCPAIPNLLCVTQVAGVPFEYVALKGSIVRDRNSGLYVVNTRISNRKQKFVPQFQTALEHFIANMQRFGMPIEAILTMGSLYCRCVRNTDRLSDHSYGEAMDIAGVRWRRPGGSPSTQGETLIHNHPIDAGERNVLRRINACLRLSFPLVVDYHHKDHDDHFHCDLNRIGSGAAFPRKRQQGSTTMKFVQEMLPIVTGLPVPITGKLDQATAAALAVFGRVPAETLKDLSVRNAVLDRLFTHIASGGAVTAVPPVKPTVPAPPLPTSRVGKAVEQLIVRTAILRGERGLNKLTNQVFFARHPELGGRKLRPDEHALVREWLDVRDTVVKPLLASTPPAARAGR